MNAACTDPSLQPRIEQPRLRGERTSCDRMLEVYDPYSGHLVGTVGMASAQQVSEAIEWAASRKVNLTRFERSRILMATATMLGQRADEAARLITAESGLSLKDTRHEVRRVVDVLEFAAREVLQEDGEIYACDVTQLGQRRKCFTVREPLDGVVAAITPFNHPMNQVAHKVVPCIAVNGRMLLKPSERTPLSALFLADLLYEAGLPKEMFQVAVGDPSELVPVMATHPRVDLVTFTGGVANGKRVANLAGYRRCVLELGGNDPLIVLDDADPLRAAKLAAQGSYKNSGQRCTAVKRMLVHKSIADEFVHHLVEQTHEWRYGNPMAEATDMGTLIDEASARRVESAVDAAIQGGARVLTGHKRDGALYSPTVVVDVQADMELVKEETFGPVSPVIVFDTVDQAIELANGTRYGLSSGVCTDRMDLISRFVNELRVGTVNFWEVPGYRIELTPFGGIKDSGLGHKEGVREAIKCYSNIKTWTIPWQ